MVGRLRLAATILSGLAAAAAALISAQWLALAAALAICAIWLAAQQRGAPFGAVALCCLTILAAAQVIFGAPAALLVLAVVAALCAYDLDCFTRRLATFDVIQRAELERAHLQRLSYVTVASLVVGETAALVRLRLEFGWLVLLAGLGIVLLGRMIRRLRKIE
jgi:hypothetical protein